MDAAILALVLINHALIHANGYSFAFDAPTLWNALPDNIRAAPPLATFRNRLKTYLLQQGVPSIVSLHLFHCIPWCVTSAMSLDMNIDLSL